GRRRRLGVDAARRSPTAFRRWRGNLPKLLSGGDLQRGQTGFARRSAKVGNRDVDILGIGGEAPLDATESAPPTYFNLPMRLVVISLVESPHDARFLAAQQNLLAIGECAQDRRAAEVMIGSSLIRAVGYARLPATHQVVVFERGLVHPFDLSRLHLERHDRVRVPTLNVGVGIAGANVDQLALQIERRSRPDRASRGAVHLGPGGILLERLRLLLNGETLPEDLPCVSVERDKAATEGAALV